MSMGIWTKGIWSKRIVAAVLAGLAAAVAAPALAQQKVVHIYNWSDYIDPQVLKDFTKETGIRVVYDTYDSNDTLETKLLAGRTGYDVVVPSASNLAREIKAGALKKLDKAKLPNLKNLWDFVTKGLADYDPGNQYAVNYMWGTTGIGYNVDQVAKRLPSAPLDSWDMIFKVEVISKLADCGVNLLDSSDDLIPPALLYLGLNPDSHNVTDIAKAGDLLKKIRPFVRKFNSSEYIDALANGDICLTVGYSGDILQARTRAVEAKKGVKVGYSIPKEGALLWFDSFAIPRDAPHTNEALAFIDYMSRPEIAARNSNFLKYANGNKESQKLIDPTVFGDPSIYPDEAMMKKLFLTHAYDARTQREATRIWTAVKAGK
ncbi:MAG: polyamine ABC transporter substrate-binding protein [Bauldia sp.]